MSGLADGTDRSAAETSVAAGIFAQRTQEITRRKSGQ